MLCIIWVRPDSRVSVTLPNENDRKPRESDQAFIDRVEYALRKPSVDRDGNMVPAIPVDWTKAAVVQMSSIPTDREFRDAWIYDSVAGVQISMAMARDVWRQRMRSARAPLLVQLDISFMRAIESGDNELQAAITARKEELRNVTEDPGISSASTIPQLKQVWPSCLTAPLPTAQVTSTKTRRA